MVPGRDRTRDPWICSKTLICSQTRYRLRYAARSFLVGGGGAQLLLISFATTRLHGICTGSINRMEDGGGGGTHYSPTALGLGISAPHPPQISEFFAWDWEGGTKRFYPPRPDYRRFLCPHCLLFFQQSCNVGNLLSYKSQYHIMHD